MKDPASFRDPSGFVFLKDGTAYRQINSVFKDDFDFFLSCGLYEKLSTDGFIVSHEDAEPVLSPEPETVYRIIKPEQIKFISYPYEWSFSQLKDAALLTLAAQKTALAYNMRLRDASAYNVQFRGCKPVLIDTLSFERYREGEPWDAYGQFCRHFLAPLALMAKKDIRLGKLSIDFIDGVPLDLTSKLLPFSTKFNPGLLANIHAHARMQSKYGATGKTTAAKVTKFGLLGIIDMLESAVRSLNWRPEGTEWADYYGSTNYSGRSFEQKKGIVAGLLDRIPGGPGIVWDLGANTGVFSRVAAEKAGYVVSFDIDAAAVEKNYLECVKTRDEKLLPLVQDLTNPSPGIGWANTERKSVAARGGAKTAMALALLHHLTISNNTVFQKTAEYLSSLCCFLVIEFVPKEDSQVQRLLAGRKDIFAYYDIESMKKSYSEYFDIIGEVPVPGTVRTLFLMNNKKGGKHND